MLRTVQSFKLNMGVAGKLVTAISTLMIVMVTVVAMVNVKTQQDLILKKTLLHVHDISSLLNESSVNHLQEYNVGKLRLLLSDVSRNPNVVYSYVFDESGAILTDGTEENSQRDQILNDSVSLNSIAATSTLQQFKDGIVDVTQPTYLGTKKIGGIRIGFSLVSLEEEKKQIMIQNIQLSVFFYAIALATLYWIAKRITQPLNSFTRAIAHFDLHDDKQITNFQRTDEIGELSREFDNLIYKLRHTTASKQHLDEEVACRIETEKKLRAAIKEANTAVEIKSQFLANMSHEIRTPMNGILGMLDLLLNGQLYEEQAHRVKIAKSSADSLLILLNDILDFSKIDAGKLELENIEFDLLSLIGEISESMALQAQEKNIELVLDLIPIEHPIIKSDPSRLRQILTNLLANAIKFTEAGEIVVSVELLPDSSCGGSHSLHCKISDTGIGIPEDKQATLFDAFNQADSSTTRKFGGTGLGLSITKKLCQLMGGDIRVKSLEGVGSCFEFSIDVEVDQHSSLGLPDVDISNLSILLVDDNATNRCVLRSQLAHWGAHVVEANSGKRALRLCEEHWENSQLPFFDLGLIDMQMPTMNGESLGRALRSESNYQNMKLVLMTSMVEEGNRNDIDKLGFNGYFPKPATTADLLKALSTIVDDSGVEQPLPRPASIDAVHSLPKAVNNSIDDESIIPKAKILLVDDNLINQMVALGRLKALGLQADVASNGLEAIHSLKCASHNQDPFSLVLMDCQMPDMDGYEATQHIRLGDAGDNNKSIPIIAMTASAMRGDREKCLGSGMNDYLTKPVDQEKLREKLIYWLEPSCKPPLN